MKILQCFRLPTSAVQANKAQKRQMSIMREKEKKSDRGIKKSGLIRASETGVPGHCVGQLWPQCFPGDRHLCTTRNVETFTFIQSLHPCPPPPPHLRSHRGNVSYLASREKKKTKSKPIEVLRRELSVELDRRTNPDIEKAC